MHRAATKTWGKILLEDLKEYKGKLIGFSATPERTDGKNPIETIFNDEEIEPYEFVATKGLSGARYCRKLHLCADCLNIEVKKFNYEFKEFCVRTGLTLEEK